jgi:TonB family protein
MRIIDSQKLGLTATLSLHLLLMAVVMAAMTRPPLADSREPLTVKLYASDTPAERESLALIEPVLAVADADKSEPALPEQVSAGPLEKSQDIPLLTEPNYLPDGQVDVKARPLSSVVVPYPKGQFYKTSGSVSLLVYVNRTGTVDRVEILGSNMPDDFIKEAIQAFMNGKMQPALKNGTATHAKMRVLVEFEAK